jgi:hypothetical protein
MDDVWYYQTVLPHIVMFCAVIPLAVKMAVKGTDLITFLGLPPVRTFGSGLGAFFMPSQLPETRLRRLFASVVKIYPVSENAPETPRKPVSERYFHNP